MNELGIRTATGLLLIAIALLAAVVGGYPFALFLCALSAVLPLLWFRWRDWI